ncbi:hypothetical protein BDR26DRAFT_871512 [Obelidium mucronatum]|nr:hypothetical protein BDR26DRAFT_871512 [Obelidium mucronatum]
MDGQFGMTADLASFLAQLQQQQQVNDANQSNTQQAIQPNQRPQRHVSAPVHYVDPSFAQAASITRQQAQPYTVPTQRSTSRAAPAPKRGFSVEQINSMETTFQRNNTPDRDAMELLAHEIGLTYEQVRKWMSRRRIKEKEKGTTQSPSTEFIREGSTASDEPIEVILSPSTDAPSTDAPSTDAPSTESATETSQLQPTLAAPVAPQPAPPVTMDDIDFEEPSHVTRYLKFLSLADGAQERKERINLEDEIVSDEFYQGLAQSKGFKGLILLRQWMTESKDGSHFDLLKSLLELLEKLPVTLEGIKTSKLGKALQIVLKADGIDAETKAIGKRLTAAWTELVTGATLQQQQGQGGEATTAPVASNAPLTAADRKRLQNEREEAIAAAAALRAQSLLATVTKRPTIQTEISSENGAGASAPTATLQDPTGAVPPELKYARYRKVAKASSPSEASPIEESPVSAEPVAVVLNEHGVKSILSSTITPDVDPMNPRKKKKAVKFAAELVKTRYFNTEDDVMAAGDRHFKNKSARDSEKGEGRRAFQKEGNREIKAAIDWKTPRPMAMKVYPPPSSTPETIAQDSRERSILSVSYYVDEDIPANPAEPDEDYGEDDMEVSLSGGRRDAEVIDIPLFDSDSQPQAAPQTVAAATPLPFLSGLGGLNALLAGGAQAPITPLPFAGLGVPPAAAPAPALNFLMALQQQQQQQQQLQQQQKGITPDASNLLKLLGVAAPPPPPPAPSSQFPAFLQAQNQQPQQQQPIAMGIPSLSFLQQQQTAAPPTGLAALLSNLQRNQQLQGGIPSSTAGVPPAFPAFLQQQQQQQQQQQAVPQQLPSSLLNGLAAFQQQANAFGNANTNNFGTPFTTNTSNKHARQEVDDNDEEQQQRIKRFAESGYQQQQQQQQQQRKPRGEMKPKGKCNYWAQGKCQFGANCFNLHEGEGGTTRNF